MSGREESVSQDGLSATEEGESVPCEDSLAAAFREAAAQHDRNNNAENSPSASTQQPVRRDPVIQPNPIPTFQAPPVDTATLGNLQPANLHTHVQRPLLPSTAEQPERRRQQPPLSAAAGNLLQPQPPQADPTGSPNSSSNAAQLLAQNFQAALLQSAYQQLQLVALINRPATTSFSTIPVIAPVPLSSSVLTTASSSRTATSSDPTALSIAPPPAGNNDMTMMIQPTQQDVLFGRGQPTRDHPGNQKMRQTVARYSDQFQHCTDREQKTVLTRKIVAEMKRGGSRFLKPCGAGWTEVPDQEARHKLSHAMRDRVARINNGSSAQQGAVTAATAATAATTATTATAATTATTAAAAAAVATNHKDKNGKMNGNDRDTSGSHI